MAVDGGYLMPSSFAARLEEYAADQLEKEILWAMAPPFTIPTEAQKRKAREIRERIVSEGKLYEVLEATMPEPCPTCGEIPSR